MARSIIHGFSKLSKTEQIEIISKQIELPELISDIPSFWHAENQKLFDGFSENTLTNYYLPYGIAPNFMINGNIFHIPMVVEESSVVAAASAAAKFWLPHGGFHAEVSSTQKTGQVHFTFSDDKQLLLQHWKPISELLLSNTKPLTAKMESRGGGVFGIQLKDCTAILKDYFQIQVVFETVDSMGANFINSVLEEMSITLLAYCSANFPKDDVCEIIMSILSNYTPDCKVKCWVETPIGSLKINEGSMTASKFLDKFVKSIQIAELDTQRAVTHNKGIMNGVDAVVLATGNDFRAVEAGIHAYAARNGRYSSLSRIEIRNEIFTFSLEIPLTIGTIGGLTSLHPLAKRSLEILGNPTVRQLMMIIASAGLANHFSAIKALITKGIQQGHMKMHLNNILMQLKATIEEKTEAIKWFADKTVSHSAVQEFLDGFRNSGKP